jgi:hypothetical protein
VIVARLVAAVLVTYLVLEVAWPRVMAAAAVAAAGTATAAATAAAPARACGPVAVVRGPSTAATMRAAIEGRLRADGLVFDPRVCPEIAVRASVAPRRGVPSFTLDIEDAFGRRSRRPFDDAGTAASLIESFAFPEDSEVLRTRSAPVSQWSAAPGGQPEPGSRPPASPAGSPPDGTRPGSTPPSPTRAVGDLSAGATATAAADAPPSSSRLPHFSLGASIGTLAASDDSLWYGGSLSFCAQLGSLCAGARAELARDFAAAGPAVEGGNPARTTGALLLALGRPFRSAHVALTPLLAVGLDWMRVAIAAQDKDPASSADVLGLRAEGILAGALRLTARWAIRAELVASLGPRLWRSESGGFAAAASDNPGVDTNPLAQVRLGLGVEYTR